MSVYNIASYPGVRGKGRRKRTPGAHSLRMRLIKSPFCDDTSSCGLGFAMMLIFELERSGLG